jgi:tetratricopeptide (TPR) repeat protein
MARSLREVPVGKNPGRVLSNSRDEYRRAKPVGTHALVLGICVAVFAATLPFVATPAVAAEMDKNAKADAKTAMRLYKEGNYEDAAKIFVKLSVAYPDMLVFVRNLGACYYYMRRYEPALSNLRDYEHRKKDIAPDDRAEIAGWIGEMERIRDQAAAAAAPAATPTPPAAPVPIAVPIAPTPTPPSPPATPPSAPAEQPSVAVEPPVPPTPSSEPASAPSSQPVENTYPQQGPYGAQPSYPQGQYGAQPQQPTYPQGQYGAQPQQPSYPQGQYGAQPQPTYPQPGQYGAQPAYPTTQYPQAGGAYPPAYQQQPAAYPPGGYAAGGVATPASPPPSSGGGRKAVAWILGVAGVGGLVAGGVCTAMALSKFSKVQTKYDPATEKQGKDFAKYQWLGYGAGAALLTTAIIVGASGGSSSPSVALAPVVGPGAAGATLSGSF